MHTSFLAPATRGGKRGDALVPLPPQSPPLSVVVCHKSAQIAKQQGDTVFGCSSTLPIMPETEEERRARKEREHQAKKIETPEERAARKAREAERDARRKEETPEERATRKAKEAERDGQRREETAEERAARKERERQEREKETPEERAARKAREAERDGHRREETTEERAARKERERQEREKETPEERAARKAKEAEREARRREETPEERAARKEREAAEKQKREVVHKPLPQTLQQQQQAQLAQQAAPPPRAEPVVQARNPKLPPPPPKKDEPEEYDDDFVDGFEVEQMLEAQKAVAAENAALKKSAATSSGAGGGTPGTPAPPAFVGQSRFAADDLQRQQYRAQFDRDLARATALRRLVDLDDVSAVIADIPPLSEYDMYIRNFGNTGRQQSGVQAPPLEDKIDAEVQADRVQLKGKGSQVPEDLGLFPEKLASQLANVPSDAAVAGGGGGGDAQSKDAASGSSIKKGPAVVDATLLSNFLSRVFPVMRTLLDEADFNSSSNLHKSSLPFSSTFTSFTVKESAQRPVVGVSFSTVASQYFLSVHGPSGRASRPHKSGAANTSLNAPGEGALPADRHAGLAVVWNSNDPSMPDKILVHSSRLTQGCFSPTRPHLVYASCADGAVCVWDLREPDSSHATDERISTVTLRCPSYSSGWQTDNHSAEIVAMCVAGYNSMIGMRREESDQLVTLDARGNVYFWMVSDGDASRNSGSGSGSVLGVGVSGASGAGSSDQDHGQLMASSVRVFRASTMTAFSRASTSSPGMLNSTSAVNSLGGGSYGRTVFSGKLASDIDFCPADASRFVVAAGTSIAHLSRFSSITAPSEYAPKSQFVGESTATPSSVTFSSLDSRILLGGYNDGTVRVYLRDEGHPQLSIPVSSSPIRRLRASNTTKLITYALDDNGAFFILDHGIEEKEVPVVQCAVGTAATGKCLTFDVPPEDKAVSQLIFGFENGAVQLHQLNQTWLVPASARSDKWL